MPTDTAPLSKGERTRLRILESGFELFLSQGSHAVSIRQIAAAAGLSPMAIYRHFDDKSALQVALLEHAFLTFEQFLRASPGSEQPIENLCALAKQFFTFALERAPQFRFLFLSDARVLSSDSSVDVQRLAMPTFELLVEAVQRCIDAGCMASSDARTTAFDVLSFAVGRAALVLSGNTADTKYPIDSAMVAFVRFINMIRCMETADRRRRT